MSINVNDKNIGHATAYAYYKAGGGTMTEAEFTEFMADFGTASQTAVEAAQAALASQNAAQTAATTATTKASEATTAAQTATTKAGEASTSANTATSAKDTAVSASQTATTKASEATTAAATATSAATTATTAKDDAVSAKTAAQTAQTGAETAAASVQSSAAQIQTNADDISELKEDLTAVAEDINSGDIMFQDGTFTEPEKSLDWSTNTRKIQYVDANTEKHLIMSFSDVAGTKTVSCAFSQMSGFNTNGVRFSTTEYPFVVLRTKSNLPLEANSTFKFFFYRADGSSGFNFVVPIPTGEALIVVDIKGYIRAHGDDPSVHTLVEPDGIRTSSYTYATAPNCEVKFMGMFTKEQAEHYNLKKYIDSLNVICNDYNFSKLNDYSCMSMFRSMGVVGDSWASGSVHTPDGYVDTVYEMSWGQILGRKLGITVSNYSSGGLTTKTWLTASAQYGGLAKLLSEDPQNLYLLNLGINDRSAINGGTEILGTVDDIKDDYTENPDTFYGNYGRIIGNIKDHAPKAIIILISMLPKLSRTMDEYIEEIAEKCEVPFIQVTDDEYFTSDYFYNANFGGHMCVLGYSGVANAIERLMQKYMVNHITDFAYYDGLTISE